MKKYYCKLALPQIKGKEIKALCDACNMESGRL